MASDVTAELARIEADEREFYARAEDFDSRRKASIVAAMPVGTRVRWRQTAERDVFEAEGVVTAWTCGVNKESGEPWTFVEFTKHPNLTEARLAIEGPFGACILLRNLEVLTE